MLELWPVSAPHAHARVRSIDTADAAKMPGVVAVYTARDIPGMNDVGALRHDESLLADPEVMFHGHMVAIVVATSYEVARAAAARVKVEYEPLPAILSIEAAVDAKSFHTDPHTIRRGDVGAALANAPMRLDGVFEMGGQEHFYLETHAAWAERGDDGDVSVVSSTQHPSEIQAVVAHVLDLPRNKVVVQSPRMGGGFGGKETQGNTWAALVALAAWKTGRRVRVQLDRDLDMMLTGKRHPFRASFEVGFDRDGKILALKAALFSNGGWSLDLSESICDRALFHIDNAYYIPSVEVTGRVCKTHSVSNTAFRGFGGPQGMLVIEDVMDRIARRTGLRPEDVRARNLYRESGETNTTHYGQDLEDNRIQTIWSSLAKEAEFEARRRDIDAFNRTSPRVKRGIAITPVKFGISFTASFLNQAGALVLIYRDGSIQVNHGGTEMGQGLYTKMLGIAMRELGVNATNVRMMKTQTDKVPNTSPTAASAGADLNGQAVRNACVTLRERIAPVAARLLAEKGVAVADPSAVEFVDGGVRAPGSPVSIPFGDVAAAAYIDQIQLSATGYYRTPGLKYDRAKGHGKPFHYYAYGAAVSEVEVDGYTGMKRVRRVDVLHDVGESLHPSIDRGQIEGGFVQGMGWLTGEELKWDAKGRLLAHSASTYQIPAISDAPADFRVRLLPRAAQGNTIHGSKAVGEPPLMLAIAVREAIRDAVAAFGKPGGEVDLPSPATHEAIFHAVNARLRLV
jgi:xanthine dehydrogenase molybdopterin binding subunit